MTNSPPTASHSAVILTRLMFPGGPDKWPGWNPATHSYVVPPADQAQQAREAAATRLQRGVMGQQQPPNPESPEALRRANSGGVEMWRGFCRSDIFVSPLSSGGAYGAGTGWGLGDEMNPDYHRPARDPVYISDV
jgi:hypothetical protein